LRKEARILVHLHHDAIARYHVVSTDTELGVPFLAMELVKGPSLGDRMEAGPLEPASLASLQQHLAEGLEKAHRAGVIHRHLAPDKIVLPDGRVDRAKIIDFGVVGGAQLAGSYDFVSPEQLGLFGGEVTSRSDIYSLGLVLAACALGRALDMGGSRGRGRRKAPLGPRPCRDRPAAAKPARGHAAARPAGPAPVHGRGRQLAHLREARARRQENQAVHQRSEKHRTAAELFRLRRPAARGCQAKTRLVVTALAATAILLAAVYVVYW
jgi:hypothetical protein